MPCHFGNFDNTAEVEYPWHWSGLGTPLPYTNVDRWAILGNRGYCILALGIIHAYIRYKAPFNFLKKLERANRHVGEEGRNACRRIPTAVRHASALFELELLEVGAAGGDRPEPAVRHLRAAVASL